MKWLLPLCTIFDCSSISNAVITCASLKMYATCIVNEWIYSIYNILYVVFLINNDEWTICLCHFLPATASLGKTWQPKLAGLFKEAENLFAIGPGFVVTSGAKAVQNMTSCHSEQNLLWQKPCRLKYQLISVGHVNRNKKQTPGWDARWDGLFGNELDVMRNYK